MTAPFAALRALVARLDEHERAERYSCSVDGCSYREDWWTLLEDVPALLRRLDRAEAVVQAVLDRNVLLGYTPASRALSGQDQVELLKATWERIESLARDARAEGEG